MKKLGITSILLTLTLGTALAGTNDKTKTPKSAKQCAKHASEGWAWQDNKCVKSDANAKTKTATATDATKTEKTQETTTNQTETVE